MQQSDKDVCDDVGNGRERVSHIKIPDLFAPVLNAPSRSGAPDMYAIIQNQVRMLTDGDITKREKVLEALAWDALEELNAQVKEARTLNQIEQCECKRILHVAYK